jgi:DNA-binding MarR family transcriptional regulator
MNSRTPAARSAMIGLHNALSALEVLTTERARTFIAVAANEGKSIREYASVCNVSKSLMSRRLLDLGDGQNSDKTKPGAGLIEVRADTMDRRISVVKLSHTGRAMAERLARIMGEERAA